MKGQCRAGTQGARTRKLGKLLFLATMAAVLVRKVRTKNILTGESREDSDPRSRRPALAGLPPRLSGLGHTPPILAKRGGRHCQPTDRPQQGQTRQARSKRERQLLKNARFYFLLAEAVMRRAVGGVGGGGHLAAHAKRRAEWGAKVCFLLNKEGLRGDLHLNSPS
jgi:hypothetical protein